MKPSSLSIKGAMVAVIAAVTVVALAVCALPRPKLTHHTPTTAQMGVLR